MAITLIGYRGCGKSTVGPLLAQRLGWDCIDSDHEIERRAGKSIRDIFGDDGEASFRRLEAEVLRDLLTRSELVIAAGGGAILSEVTRQRMKQSGPVIWLQATAATLASRISGDAESALRRPSLTGKSVADEVAEVLAARTAFYHDAATFVIDAETAMPQDIAGQVYESMKGQHTQETL